MLSSSPHPTLNQGRGEFLTIQTLLVIVLIFSCFMLYLDSLIPKSETRGQFNKETTSQNLAFASSQKKIEFNKSLNKFLLGPVQTSHYRPVKVNLSIKFKLSTTIVRPLNQHFF